MDAYYQDELVRRAWKRFRETTRTVDPINLTTGLLVNLLELLDEIPEDLGTAFVRKLQEDLEERRENVF